MRLVKLLLLPSGSFCGEGSQGGRFLGHENSELEIPPARGMECGLPVFQNPECRMAKEFSSSFPPGDFPGLPEHPELRTSRMERVQEAGKRRFLEFSGAIGPEIRDQSSGALFPVDDQRPCGRLQKHVFEKVSGS